MQPPTPFSYASLWASIFDSRAHTRRKLPSTQRPPRSEGSMRMISTEFDELQRLTDAKFTWDAYAPDTGSVMGCPSFSSQSKPFLQSDINGHHVWLFCPYSSIESCIQHIYKAWSTTHDTSACVLIPQSMSYVVDCFDGFAQQLAKYPANARIFTDGISPRRFGTSQPLCAYHIPPRPMRTNCLCNSLL